MNDEFTRCVQEINAGKKSDGKAKEPWMTFEDFWCARSQQVENGVGFDKVAESLNKDGLPPRLARSLAENGIESKEQFVQFVTEAEKVWWYGAYGRLESFRGCKKVSIQKLAKWAGITITKRKSRGVPPRLSERQKKSWAIVEVELIGELTAQNAALREDKERLDWIDANRPKLDKWNNQFFVGAAFTREGHKDIRAAIDVARARKKA